MNEFYLSGTMAVCLRKTAFAVFILILGIVNATANNDGRTGRTSLTSVGCGGCHGSSSSGETTVSVSSASGSFTVDAGSTTTFTLAVAHDTQPAAGCNIAVKTTETGNSNVGTLAPAIGSGLKLSNSELTHTSPQSLSGGTVEFEFTWTAPQQPGTYFLRAIANAVNQNNMDDAADDWNWMTPVVITVTGPEVVTTAPNGGEEWCVGASHEITWTSTGVDNVRIELSSDGGQTFPTELIASTPAAAGSWTWDMPETQTPGTQYRVRVVDITDTDVSDEGDADCSIFNEPVITSQPNDLQVCNDEFLQLAVFAQGFDLTYQWRLNGQNISGATEQNYSVNNADAADVGTYDVVITSGCNTTVTSESAEVTLQFVPTITSQPLAQSVCAGESFSFAVEAEGADLMYQWKRNGLDISGATASTYTGDATTLMAGTITVEVFGACEPSVTSDPVLFSVNTLPEITQEPTSQVACLGEAATFSVNATGADIEFEWRRNGAPIPGANQATLIITPITPDDAGTYDVIVSGACEPDVMSQTVNLSIIEGPEIISAPMDQTITEGSTVILAVIANGPSLSYQWRKNGQDIPDATEEELNLGQVEVEDSGEYDCLVSNQCTEESSVPATLTVIEAGAGPIITLSGTSVAFGKRLVDVNSGARPIEITNTGDEPLELNGLSISGPHADEFTFTFPGAMTLEPAASFTTMLRVMPTSPGLKMATLEFTSNAQINPQVSLTAEGGTVGLDVEVTLINFGNVRINEFTERSVTIENTGSFGLNPLDISIENDAFTIVDPPLPISLAAGEQRALTVRFAPQAQGSATGRIDFTYVLEGVLFFLDIIELDGFGEPVVSVGYDAQVATDFAVTPNPVRDIARFEFTLSEPGDATLSIVDMYGKTAYKNTYGYLEAGKHSVIWEAPSHGILAAGAYRAALIIGNRVITIPMIVVR